MSFRSVPAVSAPNVASVALLRIAGLNLVMPQVDVRAVESVSDIDFAEPPQHAVGWVAFAQQRWPVYCLDQALVLLPRVPAERRACVLLAWERGYVGLTCDDVSVTKQVSAQHYALPPAMSLPETPVQSLLAYEGGIACATSGQRLAAHLVRLAAQ